MFIFDGKIKIHATIDETVIKSTHRLEDLIPAFLEVIKGTDEYVEIMQYGCGLSDLSQALKGNKDEYWWSDECLEFQSELLGILNNYSPDGVYFGQYKTGDDNYGFWTCLGYKSGVVTINIDPGEGKELVEIQDVIVVDENCDDSDIEEKGVELLKEKYGLKFYFNWS